MCSPSQPFSVIFLINNSLKLYGLASVEVSLLPESGILYLAAQHEHSLPDQAQYDTSWLLEKGDSIEPPSNPSELNLPLE